MALPAHDVVADSIRRLGRVGPELVSKAVGRILLVTGMVGIRPHGAVKVERGVALCHEGTVDGDLVEVDTDAVILGVSVEEHAELEKRVGRILNAGNHAAGGEGGLLDVAGEVLGILVEDEAAKLLERELVSGPDLGHVKGVKAEKVGVGLLGLHHLDEGSPLNLLAGLNGVPEVTLGIIWITAAHSNSLGIGKLLLAVLGEEGVLDVHELTLLVDPLERVAAVAMVVSPANRSAVV